MSFIEILLIAVGLAMDAFAVSLAAASGGFAGNSRAKFRLAFHFGLFQAVMPIIGWGVGASVVQYIESSDHWVAFGLLAVVGARMIRSGCSGESVDQRMDPSRGWALVMLSLATSVDALAVGLSLGVIRTAIWYPAVIIGMVTAGLCLVAISLGHRLGKRFGPRMEVVGGIVLFVIGGRILITHMWV